MDIYIRICWLNDSRSHYILLLDKMAYKGYGPNKKRGWSGRFRAYEGSYHHTGVIMPIFMSKYPKITLAWHLSDHRRERRGQIEAATKDHGGGSKDQVSRLDYPGLAPLRIGHRLNSGGRKEATRGSVQPLKEVAVIAGNRKTKFRVRLPWLGTMEWKTKFQGQITLA